MPNQEIIDQLIATYRDLNMKVRGREFGSDISPEQLIGKSDSVPAVLFALRNRELNASQAVKSMLLGGEATGDDEPAVLSEQQVAAGTSPRVLLSRFGTAENRSCHKYVSLRTKCGIRRSRLRAGGRLSLKTYLPTLVDRAES